MRALLFGVLVAALIPSLASGQSSAKPSKEQLRQNAIDHRQKQADFKQRMADWRADNQARHAAEYDVWASRQQQQAPVVVQPPAYFEPYPMMFFIRPYDPITDYWGIYAPGHPRASQGYVITVP